MLLVLATTALRPSAPLCGGRPLGARRARQTACTSTDVFASSGWSTIQPLLEALPVFTVATEEGTPIQYELGGTPLATFYVDVEAAKAELTLALRNSTGLDLIPVGLGTAYALSRQGKALLIPGRAELLAAGAPPDANPTGQALPLFACMSMAREGPEGKPELPLFLSHADCKAAVAEATEADSPETPLEIVGLSLPSVIERLSSASGELAFAFVPPSASTRFIEDYLAGSAPAG